MSALECLSLPGPGARFSLSGFLRGQEVVAQSDGLTVRLSPPLFAAAMRQIEPVLDILDGPTARRRSIETDDAAVGWLVACIRAIEQIVTCEMQDGDGRVSLRYDTASVDTASVDTASVDTASVERASAPPVHSFATAMLS